MAAHNPHRFNLTVSFDHHIVDGAPAARFARRLKVEVESGDLLVHKETDDRLILFNL